MGYPTTVNWQEADVILGASAPAVGVMGQGASNGSQPAQTVTQPAGDTVQKYQLGQLCRFKDLTYGVIEAIYLKGVASTAAGDCVRFDPKNATTVRIITTSDATMAGPCAVALQPSVANQFGWYAVRGVVPVSTASVVIDEDLAVTGTAGQLGPANDTLATAGNIIGMNAKSAQDAPGAGFTDVLLAEPSVIITD